MLFNSIFQMISSFLSVFKKIKTSSKQGVGAVGLPVDGPVAPGSTKYTPKVGATGIPKVVRSTVDSYKSRVVVQVPKYIPEKAYRPSDEVRVDVTLPKFKAGVLVPKDILKGPISKEKAKKG